jgi:tetratricopeptide (TPR) repeat protein
MSARQAEDLHQMSARLKYVLALAALLGGCATVQQPAPEPVPVPAPAPAPRIETAAIASLMDAARADTAAGRLANAAASLERALRIEPRNPRLWQELARVHLQQGDYAQAENVAARSNAWAGSDSALRAENWRLIARAREARGDAAGAQAALEAAERQR